MREILKDPNIRTAYKLCLTLGVAYGMVLAIISLYLTRVHQFDKTTIANLATFFSVGIAAFAVPMGLMVRKLTPRVVLSIALAGYGVAVLVFPFMPGFFGLALSRAFDGAFSVGAWISLETILLLRTTSLNRGFVTGLYSNVLALGYVLGSLIAWGVALLWQDTETLVFVAAGCVAAAGAAYALTRLDPVIDAVEIQAEPSGDAPPPTGLSTAALLWRIKTACVPPFTYGYFQGSLVLYLPLFLTQERGVPEEHTKLLVGLFSLGMVLFVMYIGHLGDRFGHLKVIRTMALAGGLIAASVVYLPNFVTIALAVILAGGALSPMWPLSLALQSLISDPRDYGRANGLLNASFALGAVSGPLISSRINEWYSGEVMVLHLAAMWGVVVLASVIFRRDDPSLRPRAKAC
ncbi:MAG: MFS transporter [Myxococcales bacterium]|nr:MFS transporter [Myxococcales bacterium]